MKTNEDSKALKEVWQLKDDAYKAVEGLPLATALHARLTTSIATAAQLGFGTTRALNCAEASAEYDGKRYIPLDTMHSDLLHYLSFPCSSVGTQQVTLRRHVKRVLLRSCGWICRDLKRVIW